MNNKSSACPFVATFKKVHTSGTLEGMTTKDSLHFVSVESAQEWKRGVDKYAKRNGYTVTDMVVVEN